MRIKLLTSGYSLPLATAGLALLLPWRAADLFQQWHGLSPISHAAAQPAPQAAQSPADPPARAVRPKALRLSTAGYCKKFHAGRQNWTAVSTICRRGRRKSRQQNNLPDAR